MEFSNTRRGRRRRAAALSLAAGSLIVAATALAAPGDLTYEDCFAETNAEVCQVPTEPALDGAAGVAITPNGRSVYVTGRENDSISHFTRNPDGTLGYIDCYAEAATEGCQTPPAALNEPGYVTVSADGTSLYVTSFQDQAVNVFSVDPNGTLTYQECWADTAGPGCTVPSDAALGMAFGVAVSPNGDSVYVAGPGDNAINHFTRNADGTIEYSDCWADTAVAGCTVPAQDALATAANVAVSPGSDSVYVVAPGDSALSHFSADVAGALNYQSCFADNAGEGCTVPPQAALQGPEGVTVSPDGNSVYVTSVNDGGLTRFSRSAGGGLAFQQCFSDHASTGCTVPSPAALQAPEGVAVSPDGLSVHVVAFTSHSISTFGRGADGALSYRGCFADSAAEGCTVPDEDALHTAFAVAVSPDSRAVFVAARGDDALSRFSRELAPPPAPTPTPTPGPAPSLAGPAPFNLAAAIRKCKRKRSKQARKRCIQRAKAKARA